MYSILRLVSAKGGNGEVRSESSYTRWGTRSMVVRDGMKYIGLQIAKNLSQSILYMISFQTSSFLDALKMIPKILALKCCEWSIRTSTRKNLVLFLRIAPTK